MRRLLKTLLGEWIAEFGFCGAHMVITNSILEQNQEILALARYRLDNESVVVARKKDGGTLSFRYFCGGRRRLGTTRIDRAPPRQGMTRLDRTPRDLLWRNKR
jgi:hypothetical protein